MNNTGRLLPRARARRGMALAFSMLLLLGVMVMVVLGMIGTPNGGNNGLMFNTTGALYQANARRQSVAAFNAAEGGAQYAMQWLASLPQPPANTSAFGPAFTWAANPLPASAARGALTPDPGNPGTSFAVMIYPDASNGGNQQKKYLIEATGTSGGATQTVQVYVQVQNLSKWLILVNQWPSGNYWVSGLTSFDGPVHDNNAGGQNENVFWKSGARTPMWTYTGGDAYEVSGSGVNWYKNSWFTPGAPQTAADWQTILAGGPSTFASGAAPVNFPKNSNTQRNAALGLAPDVTPTLPTATGVTVTPGGGVYVHCATTANDVQQMTLSVDGSGNQVITVQQNDDNGHPMTTTITLNAAAGTTQVQASQQPAAGGTPVVTRTTVSGLTNGVVFCDGDIGSQGTAPGNPTGGTAKSGGLSGTIANNAYDSGGHLTHLSNLTVATDASKNCNIDGNIVYQTARQKDASGAYLPESQDANFIKNAGTFGLVSNTVLITTQDAGGNALNTVEVDGSVLAYTLYEVDQYNSRPPGNWENMGGYLSANMGYFGVGDANGNLLSGMNSNFNYDARMKDTPPPFFPTTGSTYDVLSWRRVGATLQ